jgi:hypothetical protein
MRETDKKVAETHFSRMYSQDRLELTRNHAHSFDGRQLEDVQDRRGDYGLLR